MHPTHVTNLPSIQGKILISNLHELIDDTVLHDTFSIFGTICDSKVIIDKQTGKSKGYAYVHYIDDRSAIKAIEGIHGVSISGRQINIQLLNNNDEIALWLTNQVELPQYIDLFLEHGVEDMETVQLLDTDDLKQEMIITNVEHIDEIMQCIEKLNRHDIMQQFAIDIDIFINSILPNKQETLIRHSMFKYITDRVLDLQEKRSTNIKNNIRMKACKFGSELWNVSCRGSDIDVAIAVNFKNFRNDKQKLLDDLLQNICDNNDDDLYIIDADYVKLLNATYPIVRLQHKIWKIEMDISVADRYCIPTNLYILRCIDKYEKVFQISVRKLIIFIKYWSKQRAINDAYYRYLNSFGYTMMVINYLQNVNNVNRHNLSDLIYGFFHFYATKFNFDEYSISITKCRNNNARFIKKYGSDPMEIIDPMKEPDKNQIHSYNVARRVGYYQRYFILDEFNRAYKILIHSKKSLFAQLIEKDDGKNRNVYTTFIPSHWNEAILQQIFEQSTGGKIVNIEMWRHENTGLSACLTFESLQYVQIAVEKLNDTLPQAHYNEKDSSTSMFTKTLYVCRAHKRQFENRQIHNNLTVKIGAKCDVYVGNINPQVDEEKLYKIFVKFGKIISICVIRHAGGRSKGYGFVVFDNKESATKAINMTGTMHYGNRIHVAHAHNKSHDIGDDKEDDELDDVDLTIDMLLEAKPAERKRLIGERLFPKIQAIEPKFAGRILRVLLEMDNTELLLLLSQHNMLMNMVNKTLILIKKSSPIQ